MVEKSMIERSPVRIFERAIGGGLGEGKMGVVLSRRGVGKTGFLIGLAVDQLLQGRKVLYISTKESVEHINNFFDQIFHAMAEALDMDQVPQKLLRMERNRYIHVYNRKTFSVEKLQQSVEFLKEAAGFEPDMVIMDGTPRFEKSEEWEIQDIIKLAAIEVDRQIRKKGLATKVLLQIHDELVLEVPEGELAQVEKLVKPAMESVMQLDVPLVVNISTGSNLAET